VDERIHYLMHMTMLIGGLFFWWRVLDRRRPPAGVPYPVRIGMLMVNFMMLALLGAYLASNDRVLYRGDEDLHLLGITPLADERIGGMVLWLAGGALLMVAIAVTFRRWVREMERASPVNPG
jgi:cytochrome c oxidase assembly factor CtaG